MIRTTISVYKLIQADEPNVKTHLKTLKRTLHLDFAFYINSTPTFYITISISTLAAAYAAD